MQQPSIQFFSARSITKLNEIFLIDFYIIQNQIMAFRASHADHIPSLFDRYSFACLIYEEEADSFLFFDPCRNKGLSKDRGHRRKSFLSVNDPMPLFFDRRCLRAATARRTTGLGL